MSIQAVNKTTGDTSLLAGSTLYADSPIGTILPYGGASAPSGWFLCQGQAISRANYSELFAIIGTSFGVGDGSTTFNIPDMREVVPVGAGTSNRSAITDHDDYSLGQFKDDQLQEHSHYAVTGSSTAGTEDWTQFATSHVESATGARVRGVFTDGRKGTTTHGKQLGVNYIIKAKQVGVPADFMSAVDEIFMPNYANAIEISTITVTGTSTAPTDVYTVPQDGWLRFVVDLSSSGSSTDQIALLIDDVIILNFIKGSGQYQSNILPFKAGSVIKAYKTGSLSNPTLKVISLY